MGSVEPAVPLADSPTARPKPVLRTSLRATIRDLACHHGIAKREGVAVASFGLLLGLSGAPHSSGCLPATSGNQSPFRRPPVPTRATTAARVFPRPTITHESREVWRNQRAYSALVWGTGKLNPAGVADPFVASVAFVAVSQVGREGIIEIFCLLKDRKSGYVAYVAGIPVSTIHPFTYSLQPHHHIPPRNWLATTRPKRPKRPKPPATKATKGFCRRPTPLLSQQTTAARDGLPWLSDAVRPAPISPVERALHRSHGPSCDAGTCP